MVMGMRDLRTKVLNKTGLRIDFDVGDNRTCPLRGLPAGESQSVSLSLVRKCCRERRSVHWPIRVLINKKFYGMCLHPHHHLLKMTRIVLRYEWREDGSHVPILEGVVENFYDRLFGCCINWLLALAAGRREAMLKLLRPTQHGRSILGALGIPTYWGLTINIITSEAAAAAAASPSASGRERERERVVVIRAFPAKKKRIRRLRSAGDGRTTPEPDHLNTGGVPAVETRQLLSLRRRDGDVYSHGLLLALTLVAFLYFFC